MPIQLKTVESGIYRTPSGRFKVRMTSRDHIRQRVNLGTHKTLQHARKLKLAYLEGLIEALPHGCRARRDELPIEVLVEEKLPIGGVSSDQAKEEPFEALFSFQAYNAVFGTF